MDGATMSNCDTSLHSQMEPGCRVMDNQASLRFVIVDIQAAIIPCAGRGLRMMPLTKAVSKPLLPVLDRPLIQYAIDEAWAAGCTRVILVVSPGDAAMRRYVAPDPELKRITVKREAVAKLVAMSDVPPGCDIVVAEQTEPHGLGHAVGVGCAHLGPNESFAVILPDEVVLPPQVAGQRVGLAALVDVVQSTGRAAVAVEPVDPAHTRSYGIADCDSLEGQISVPLRGVVEKPDPDDAPSCYRLPGRYILPPEVARALARTPRGAGDEIQLTDGIHIAVQDGAAIDGALMVGDIEDCGNHAGVLKATIRIAKRKPEFMTVLESVL